MYHLHHPTELEHSLINQAADAAVDRPSKAELTAGAQPAPLLDAGLCSVHLDRALPPWLMLCRQVYFEHQHHGGDSRVADGLQASANLLEVNLFPARHDDAHRVPDGTWQTHLTPAHVAHLAAQAAEGQPEPPDLQQALLVRALQAGRMPPPDLSLRVLLVGGWTGHHGRGQPGWLDLWCVPEPLRGAARPLRVVRGPRFLRRL